MLRRLIFPLLLGLGGCAILIGLGSWQLGRMDQKQAHLAEIDSRIAAAPAELPPAGQATKYQPVTVTGTLADSPLRVLVSRKQIGPGYRIIAALEAGERRVLVDLGFIRDGEPLPALGGTEVTLIGNIHTPAEVDSFTPAPDLGKNIWFARDVPAMAAALGTEPTFIVARQSVVPGISAMPLSSAGIPNDHLQYAITWFLLATVWGLMTGLLIWRIQRPKS